MNEDNQIIPFVCSKSPETIKVKAIPELIGIFFISSVGVFFLCLYIFLNALFTNELMEIIIGFAGMIFGIYAFFHTSPGLFRNKGVIFEIIPGPEGRVVQSKKKSVAIIDIKDIEIMHRGHSLRSIFYEDLVIYTHQGKIVQMKTYNLVNNYSFDHHIQKYILPYMTSDAQEAYKNKVT